MDHDATEKSGFACLPYIGNTTDRIAKILRKNNIRFLKHRTQSPTSPLKLQRRSAQITNGRNIPRKYFPRLIQESIEIHKRPDNFNREDSYRLSTTWTKLLKDYTMPVNYRYCPNNYR